MNTRNLNVSILAFSFIFAATFSSPVFASKYWVETDRGDVGHYEHGTLYGNAAREIDRALLKTGHIKLNDEGAVPSSYEIIEVFCCNNEKTIRKNGENILLRTAYECSIISRHSAKTTIKGKNAVSLASAFSLNDVHQNPQYCSNGMRATAYIQDLKCNNVGNIGRACSYATEIFTD